jgi:predicted GIY-YIG superfamily endonuclease
VAIAIDDLPHTLYRFYDATGRLLYIGIALDFLERWRKHRKKSWWPLVARMDIEQHPNRAAVFAAERQAIIIEKPVHNRQHNEAVWDAMPPGLLERWDAWRNAYITAPWMRTSISVRLARLMFMALQASGAWGLSVGMTAVGAEFGHGLLSGYLAFLTAMAGFAFFAAKMAGGLDGHLFVAPHRARPPGYWRRRMLRAVLFIR